MATAPSVRTVAAVFGLLLLAFALSSTVIYLASPARAASPGSILLNLRPFAARCPPAPPLRVFMYDLPPRFHVAMMAASRNGGFGAEGDSTAFPAWPPSAGGIRRQHSVEYWMMASLQQQQGGAAAAAEAVRVRDPAAAEAFFVPFFSSLSFNVHGRNMTDPDTEADRLLQVELMDILGKSEYWQRSAGRDHVIPMHHPNAFRFLRDMVNASVLIVSDFGRYTKELASLRKDVVAPYVHVVDSFLDDNASDPFEARPTLLFFRGRTVRKAEGKIRGKLAKILKDKDGVRFEDSLATGDGIKISTDGMRSSKFCLHPAGDTPSSCRLFDAIVSHCIPVIISSRIELPFEDEIDYSEFSLFFSVEEALEPDYLLNQLRQMPKEKWVEMWSKLKNVSSHYEFQYPPRKDDAVNMIWRQVRHKIPAVNLAIHRSRRLKVPDWW
ncbi:probable arabinosyltransferase ARAD1 [Hordeum vulgare subsp. vulgare]|uniref:Exostosin GT47 domain-containing protein n=1 Tax=Hordeum vulgare subsp. vulgare TaxID=112509 RepID=A0A8I7B6A4_HORVV|nr:probable arabinosyltransferase ARAD1 [Hordeum vulgare subsp. vulgare]